jgi:hypothetical protein
MDFRISADILVVQEDEGESSREVCACLTAKILQTKGEEFSDNVKMEEWQKEILIVAASNTEGTRRKRTQVNRSRIEVKKVCF